MIRRGGQQSGPTNTKMADLSCRIKGDNVRFAGVHVGVVASVGVHVGVVASVGRWRCCLGRSCWRCCLGRSTPVVKSVRHGHR